MVEASDDSSSSAGTITPRGENSETPPVSVHVLADRARARGEIVPSWTEKLAVAAAARQKARDDDPTGGFDEMFDSYEREITVDHKKITAGMSEEERDSYVAEKIAKGITKRDRAIAAEKEKEKKIADEKRRKDEEAKAVAEKEKEEAIKRWEAGEDDRKDTTKVVVETKFNVGTGQEVTVVKKRRPTLIAADLSGKMKESYAAKTRCGTVNDVKYLPSIIEEEGEGEKKEVDKEKGRQT